jgi:ribulose-phosphate 3-epimerase
LERIRELGVGAGIALNPATPLDSVEGCLDLCDLVLAMSVPAGFGGQPFHDIALDKLHRLKTMVDDHIMLEVDGGVKETTIQRCAEAGARYFVVGTAIFDQQQYGPVIQTLSELIHGY